MVALGLIMSLDMDAPSSVTIPHIAPGAGIVLWIASSIYFYKAIKATEFAYGEHLQGHPKTMLDNRMKIVLVCGDCYSS